MKFNVKTECYHNGRRLMPGDTLEVESKDVRWMIAQGKISPLNEAAADADSGPNNRRGRKAGATKKTGPDAAVTDKGESHE